MKYDYIVLSNEEEKNKFNDYLKTMYGGMDFSQHDLLKDENKYEIHTTKDFDALIMLFSQVFSKNDIYNVIELLRKNNNDYADIECKTNTISISFVENTFQALVLFCYLYTLVDNGEYLYVSCN